MAIIIMTIGQSLRYVRQVVDPSCVVLLMNNE